MSDEQVGNWGRWGPEDERGTLNLIDPAVLKNALSSVVRGEILELSAPIRERGSPGVKDRPPPLHFMTVDGGDYAAGARPRDGCCSVEDYVSFPIHGRLTHIDSLGHIWTGNELYNGFSRDTVRSSGMRYCGIDKIGPIVAHGVLIDVAGWAGQEHLDPGYTITVGDLEASLAREGVSVAPGDAVLIRTGWSRVFGQEPDIYEDAWPGLGIEAAEWLAKEDVSVIGADNPAIEPRPFPPSTTAPVHQLLLCQYGIHMIELLELDALAGGGYYSFLFVVAPLRITGGTGSPVNPFAVV